MAYLAYGLMGLWVDGLLSLAGRTIWSEGFGHDVPEDFEGDDFDFDVFSGSGQGDVAELFAQVGCVAGGTDRMKICLGHLDYHLDHAVAAEGVILT